MDAPQASGLQDAIRLRPALVLHQSAAFALAVIDGPDLRQAAQLLVKVAYFEVGTA